jgi:two-component system, OmpR family, phosphate regulon sensor histidine kinase PhoR
MKGSFRRIALTFVVISLLPVGFIIFELSSLNKNEKIVREIYQNQLDAILFSVNQYSDDVINSWANRITIEIMRDDRRASDTTGGLLSAFSQMNAIHHLILADMDGHVITHSRSDKGHGAAGIESAVKGILTIRAGRIERLITYYEAGFKKMETLDTIIGNEFVPVCFVLDSLIQPYRVGVMILERTSFIESVLGPRMQTIAQDKFVITAFDRRTNSAVYSTTTINADSRFSADGIESLSGEGLQKKTLWLLPGYYLGISLKEATLDDLVNDRVLTSLVLLLLLIVVLVFGMIFLYRNIRREMNLSQAKSEFVSNVSHEIRTPLSLISMYAETLEMDRVPENRKREYYSIIAKETARLSRIVNRILNFSRMDANKKKYEFSPVQINDVCAQIMDSYILHLQDQGFTHNITMQENLPVVMGDRDAISEAVINLLDNAMKYSLEKKDIQLRTFTERQTVIVEVRDRGMGIARTHHHAIFEQFFRAPSGDVHTTKGSGLGLTLVKKTMEAHHGRVTVQSSPGQGSTFRLIFPEVKTPVSI